MTPTRLDRPRLSCLFFPPCCHSFYFVTLSVSLCCCLDCHHCACVHTVICIRNCCVHVHMGLNPHVCLYSGMFSAPLIVSLESGHHTQHCSRDPFTSKWYHTHAQLRPRVCIHANMSTHHCQHKTHLDWMQFQGEHTDKQRALKLILSPSFILNV